MNYADETEQALFAVAVALEDPAARQAFLDDVCAANPQRLRRLQRLIQLHAQADAFFHGAAPALALSAEGLAAALPPPAVESQPIASGGGERPGCWIGRYQLVKPIGEGGSGVVWLAEQQDPVRRRVALKVIRHGMDHDDAIARFRSERQSLAWMDHPNIARVLDAGATEMGKPFFVMEWVRGLPITRDCDEKRLALHQRIELFIQVCHAIQHAHQKGVIHRDIKPSNVLVASHDGKPMPKVIDFGIAKTTADLGESVPATTGLETPWLGTPVYMSPEQANAGAVDVDTRSDVYSLGILLYELLVGQPPWSAEEFAAHGSARIREILLEQVPDAPSVRFNQFPPHQQAAIAAQRNCRPRQILAMLHGDLDSIIMKALAKDRSCRYDTANGLALDLLRFLNHDPVVARPPCHTDRLRKWVRRNRVTFVAATTVLLTLLVGLILTTSFYVKEREARQEQARLRHEATVREQISRAAVLLSEGNFTAADAALRSTPLSAVTPSRETADVLRSLGEWNALRSRWSHAAECFVRLDQANRVEHPTHLIYGMDLLMPGPCLIESGNSADYDAFRRRILARFGDYPDQQAAEQTVKAALLLPFPEEMTPALQSLDRSLAASFDENPTGNEWQTMLAAWRAWALHLLKFRLGDDAGAIFWAQKSAAFPCPNLSRDTMIDAVLAMAHHRRGEHAAANACLQAARTNIQRAFTPNLAAVREPMGKSQGFWWDWLIARILLREAERLLAR